MFGSCNIVLAFSVLAVAVAAVDATAALAASAPHRHAADKQPVQEVVLATKTLTGIAASQARMQLDGAGVSIAFMDTGINYRHQAFGGCTEIGVGRDCRVKGGWDAVGDAEPGDLLAGLTAVRPHSDPVSIYALTKMAFLLCFATCPRFCTKQDKMSQLSHLMNVPCQ